MGRDANGRGHGIARRTLTLLLSGMLVVGGVPTAALAEAGDELGQVAADQPGTPTNVREMDVANGAVQDVPVPADAIAADAGPSLAPQTQEPADRYANVALRVMGGPSAAYDQIYSGQSWKLERVADTGAVGVTSLSTSSATLRGPNNTTTASLGMDGYESHCDCHAGVVSLASEGEGSALAFTAELADGQVVRLSHTGSPVRQIVSGAEDGPGRELVKFTFCDGYVESVSCEAKESVSGSIAAMGVYVYECQDISAAEVTLQGGDEYECTGSEIRPFVSQVTLNGSPLAYLHGDRQYETSYENNVLPGTGTVVVTGTGRYTGTVRKTFSIVGEAPARVNISSAQVSVAGWTYDATSHTVTPTVTLGGMTLAAGADYMVAGDTSATDAGTYSVTVTGVGSYEGTAAATYEVAPRQASVTADNLTKVEGEADPQPTATVSGTLGTDQLSYSLTRDAGETPGTYAIRPNGTARQGNYQVSFVPGTLTIVAAPTPPDDFHGTILEELRHDAQTAREAYEQKLRELGGVDLEQARRELEQAKQACDAAEARLQAAQRESDEATAALNSANAAATAANNAKAQAQSDKDQATQNKAAAQSALEAAQANQAIVDADAQTYAAIAAARDLVDQKTTAKATADAEANDAATALQQAQAAKTAADEQVTAKQSAVDQARAALENAGSTTWDLTKYNTARGSLGFFEWANHPMQMARDYLNPYGRTYTHVYKYNSTDSAIAELTGQPFNVTFELWHNGSLYEDPTVLERTPCSVKTDDKGNTFLSYTELGAEGDATNLENMKYSIEVARMCNEYRQLHNQTYHLTQHGQTATNEAGDTVYYLEPIQLNDRMVAFMQVNTNWAAIYRDHAANHGGDVSPSAFGSEILAFGNMNPFLGWYERERAYWLQNWNNPRKDPGSDSFDMEYYRYYQNATGHYFSTIGSQGDGVRMAGVGWNTKGVRTAGMDFTNDDLQVGMTEYILSEYFTVDEYRERFMTYYDAVKAAESGQATSPEQIAYNNAVAALQQAQQAQQQAATALADATTAKQQKDAAQQQAADELAQAQAALQNLLNSSNVSDLDPRAVAQALQSAQATYDQAVAAETAAQRALDDATTAAAAAATALQSAQATAPQKAAALAQASSDYGAAARARDAAQAAFDAASHNNQLLATYARAFDAAQMALDDATDVSHAEVLGVEDRAYDGTQQRQDSASLRMTLTKGDRSETYDLRQDATGELALAATYGENVRGGTGTVTLTAAGEKGSGTFWGSRLVSFQIVGGVEPATTTLSGTDWSAVYDPAYYASRNPDVARWATRADGIVDGDKLLGHFVNNGRREGRASKEGFELASYYNANADLRRAFGTDWARYYDHYRSSGQRENRACSGVGSLRGAVTSRDGVD